MSTMSDTLDQLIEPVVPSMPPTIPLPQAAGVAPALLTQFQTNGDATNRIHRIRFEEDQLPGSKEFRKGILGLYSCNENKDLVGYVPEEEEEECTEAFDTARDLKKHLRKHVTPVICPLWPGCDARKAEQADMREHLRVSHAQWAMDRPEYGVEFGPFTCKKCKAQFSRSDNLTKHRKNNVRCK
ncbi:hypothetical protein BJ166DRAFT_190786 [Pestalotiopsis sp. NC0098]|nr:hypothetical protein BJ166DRAFT_190786 [Pestalotiopsis sp. NC0098]